MNESDIPKMAIIIPFCLSELLFMPFGLINAGQTFQNLMDSLFHSFPFIFIYLDGILVFSRSRSGHLSYLETNVLASLAPNGPRLNSWVIWSPPLAYHFSLCMSSQFLLSLHPLMSNHQWWAKLLRLLTVNSLSYFVKIKY
jgi:hypothetical protein